MIQFKVEDAHIPDRLRRMAQKITHPRRPLVDLGGHWQRRVKMSMPHLPLGRAAAPGKPPAVHDSEYVHSVIYESSRADQGELGLGSSSIRARLLQKGGTVRPKRAKMLAIPIAAESYGKRPRDFSGLAIMGSGGRAVLGRDGVPLFVLVRSATIKPHPHLGMTEDDWDYLGGALKKELDGEWER